MKKYYKIAVLLFITGSLSFAGSNGGYAGAFLRMGLGAKTLAMGNAGLAQQADGYSFFYNPASMAFLPEKTFSLSYSFLSLDRNFNFIGYAMPVAPAGGFSISWIRAGVDHINSTNSIGEITGEIGHSINAAFFNFARRFGEKVAVGVSIKYMWESFDFGSDKYNSNGVGFDFGMQYKWNDKVLLAAAVRDVGSKLKARTDKLFEHGGTTVDPFPRLYSAGFRYQLPWPWLSLVYDAQWSDKNDFKNHFGLQIAHRKLLALRLGLNNTNFTFGAGMGFKLWRFPSQLDYAFVPSRYGEGSSHVFSWQIHF